jgi:hypothetical protein
MNRQLCLSSGGSAASAHDLGALTARGLLKLVTHCGSGEAAEFGEFSFR